MLEKKGVIGTVAAMTAGTAFFLGSYLTAKVTIGQCSEPTSIISSFDADAYLGVWYELRRNEGIPFYEENDECVTAKYELNPRGTIKVTNNAYKAYYDAGVTPESDEAVGKGEINSWFPGRLSVSFFGDIPGDYRIVDTDYSSYSVVYSCTSFMDLRISEYYWVLVRDQIEEGTTAYTDMMDTVDPIFDSRLPGYDYTNEMRTTKQGTGCQYFN